MAARVIASTLGSRSLTFWAPLVLALACSAGGGDSEGPPAFAGPLGSAGASSSTNGNTPSGTNTPTAPSGSAQTAATSPSSGTGGSSSSNEGQSGNIGIAPAQNQNQNQGQSSTPASGGAPATSTSPGANAGAAGQAMMPPAMGASGSASMPPASGQMPPANPPAAASNADCPTQFFCDGFENVTAGAGSVPAASLWKVIDDYSEKPKSDNVQISTMNAHGGKQAVRISSTSQRNGIQAVLPQSSYFIRAWLQVDAVPRGPVLIGLGTDQNAETRLRIFTQSWATINAVPGDAVAPDGARSGNCPDCTTLVANRWFCAEMGIDNNAKTATLWIDGVEAASLPDDPAQPDKPNMFIGSMGLEGGQTGVWIDDVVAGPARIGCN